MSNRRVWIGILAAGLPSAWGLPCTGKRSLPRNLCEQTSAPEIYLKDSGGVAHLCNPRHRSLVKLHFEDYREWALEGAKAVPGLPSHRCDCLVVSQEASEDETEGSALFVEITHEAIESGRSDEERGKDTTGRKEAQLIDSLAFVKKDPAAWNHLSSMAQRLCLVADRRQTPSNGDNRPLLRSAEDAAKVWGETILEAEAATAAADGAALREGTQYPSPQIEAYGFKFCRVLFPDFVEIR